MIEYSPRALQYMDETGEKLFPHIFGTDNLAVITLSVLFTERESALQLV